MNKKELKERKILRDWLRHSRALIDNKDNDISVMDLTIAELEASIAYFKRWRLVNGVKYNEAYAESRYKALAKYHYRKTYVKALPGQPETMDVSYDESVLFRNLSSENDYIRNLAIDGLRAFKWSTEFKLPENDYTPYAINGKTLSFTPDEKHLEVLARMEEINSETVALLRLIEKASTMLKTKIDEKKACKLVKNAYNGGIAKTKGGIGERNRQDQFQESKHC